MSQSAQSLSPAQAPKTRKRPALFRALGKSEPPETIHVDGKVWTLEEVLKHDSWAATAIYHNEDRRIICKMNRRQSIFGFPMRWLGRMLARREAWFLGKLSELGHLPLPCGTVFVDGKPWKNAVARPYLPGHPLAADEIVNDDFFPDLKQRLEEMHKEGMAYVDLHKRENILVGENGEGYLIDFQVCVCFPKWLMWLMPLFWLMLKGLQRADRYHFQKHVTRHRPDQVEALVSGRGYQRPNWIRLHRLFAVPLRQLRRKFLTWLKIRSDGHATSEVDPEDAVRREMETDRKAA